MPITYLIDGPTTRQCHGDLKLGQQRLQCQLHASLSIICETPNCDTTDETVLSTQGERFENIRTTPYSTVKRNLDAATGYWRAFAKSVECRGRTIELTSPMVRDDDAVDFVMDCKLHIVR